MADQWSSSIEAAGYDAGQAVLRIRFVGGGTYDYVDVPAAIATGFEAAESKGRFVNLHIKPHFAYRRVV